MALILENGIRVSSIDALRLEAQMGNKEAQALVKDYEQQLTLKPTGESMFNDNKKQ